MFRVISKVKRQEKLNMRIIFESVLMLFIQNYQSVHAWRNYSLPKLARFSVCPSVKISNLYKCSKVFFWDTVYISHVCTRHHTTFVLSYDYQKYKYWKFTGTFTAL